MDRRKKDVNWVIVSHDDGSVSRDQVLIALLMDVRDELKRINRALYCENFLDVPHLLRMIRANTAKPRKPRKPKRAAG